ncbi:MAG TPA: hypothetical protein VHS06_01395 [Chloroflexota bacterium]|nr:hypothetical protein [Chloroflexota bacterium]
MTRLFSPGLAQIKQHWSAYVILNICFYGLILAGSTYAFLRPDIQRQLMASVIQGFSSGLLAYARDAYLSRDVAAAAAITFGVNTFIGSFATLTLPSLFIPFFGSFLGLLRGLVLGVTLAPSSPELARAMVPHLPVIIVEGQGYVLAMLGVHILWTSAFSAPGGGISGFVRGYRAGLRANLAIYALIVAVLAVAAVYEAIELIYIVAR